MAAARFWRVVAIGTYSGGDLELSEIALHEGAVRVDSLASVSSTFAPSFGSLLSLQDADFGTSVRWAAASVRAPGFAIVFDFGAGVTKDITKASFAGPSRELFAHNVAVQSSSDGGDWVAQFSTPMASKWPGATAFFDLDAEFTKIDFPGIYTSSGAFERTSDTSMRYLGMQPITAPNGVNLIAVSPDGKTVVAKSLNYPWMDYARFERRSFTALPRPADPNNTPAEITFSPDGSHMAIGHDGDPNQVSIYSHSSSGLTKILVIGRSPLMYVSGCKYSPDGLHLAVLAGGRLDIYKRTGDTYAFVTGAVDVQPSAGSNRLVFSPDGALLAVGDGSQSTQAVIFYERSGDTYTKLPTSTLAITGDCRGLSFSDDGTKLAIATYPGWADPMRIYGRSGAGGKAFALLSQTYGPGSTFWNDVNFAPGSKFLVGTFTGSFGSTSPAAHIYSVAADGSITPLPYDGSASVSGRVPVWLPFADYSSGVKPGNYDMTPVRTVLGDASGVGDSVFGDTQAVSSSVPAPVDIYDSGRGRIVGTVKEKSSPVNIPLRRRVVLQNNRDKRTIREVWSDPVTGAYAFDGIAIDRTYDVISYDHTGIYRGVVADNLAPEVML